MKEIILDSAHTERRGLRVALWGLLAVALALPWGTGAAVKIYLDAHGQPTYAWINYLNPPADKQVFPSSSAVQTAQNLSNNTLPIWESIAYARTESGQKLTWYTGGTLSASSDKNFTVVVLLEDPNPTLAEEIGQGLLTSVLP